MFSEPRLHVCVCYPLRCSVILYPFRSARVLVAPDCNVLLLWCRLGFASPEVLVRFLLSAPAGTSITQVVLTRVPPASSVWHAHAPIPHAHVPQSAMPRRAWPPLDSPTTTIKRPITLQSLCSMPVSAHIGERAETGCFYMLGLLCKVGVFTR